MPIKIDYSPVGAIGELARQTGVAEARTRQEAYNFKRWQTWRQEVEAKRQRSHATEMIGLENELLTERDKWQKQWEFDKIKANETFNLQLQQEAQQNRLDLEWEKIRLEETERIQKQKQEEGERKRQHEYIDTLDHISPQQKEQAHLAVEMKQKYTEPEQPQMPKEIQGYFKLYQDKLITKERLQELSTGWLNKQAGISEAPEVPQGVARPQNWRDMTVKQKQDIGIPRRYSLTNELTQEFFSLSPQEQEAEIVKTSAYKKEATAEIKRTVALERLATAKTDTEKALALKALGIKEEDIDEGLRVTNKLEKTNKKLDKEWDVFFKRFGFDEDGNVARVEGGNILAVDMSKDSRLDKESKRRLAKIDKAQIQVTAAETELKELTDFYDYEAAERAKELAKSKGWKINGEKTAQERKDEVQAEQVEQPSKDPSDIPGLLREQEEYERNKEQKTIESDIAFSNYQILSWERKLAEEKAGKNREEVKKEAQETIQFWKERLKRFTQIAPDFGNDVPAAVDKLNGRERYAVMSVIWAMRAEGDVDQEERRLLRAILGLR